MNSTYDKIDMRRLSSQEFIEKVLNRRIELMRSVLAGKHKEYAKDDDYLLNFRTGARVADSHPISVLWGYVLKQMVCVIRILTNPDKEYTQEYIDEKIGDVMNYLVLYEGIRYATRKE